MSEYLSTEEIHEGLLELLKYFDLLCRENNLTYFLSGGTLLGAIRHEGFIPWDDDADVMMPRADYDKLITLTNKLPKTLELKMLELDANWEYPFAKLNDITTFVDDEFRKAQHGLFLDIFPIDKLPDELIKQKRIVKKIKILDVLRGSSSKKKFKPEEKYLYIKKIIMWYGKRKGAAYFAKKMNTYVRKLTKENQSSNTNGAILVPNYGLREFLPNTTFTTAKMTDFEDTRLSIPENYEIYLRSLYGDYHKLPPEEQRKGGHYRIKRIIAE